MPAKSVNPVTSPTRSPVPIITANTGYLSFNVYDKELFDSIIYPDGFEKYNFKSAIPARNRYMVDNSGYAICFVTHSWGGAAKTYERAKKKKLKIINLGVKEDGERKSDIQ